MTTSSSMYEKGTWVSIEKTEFVVTKYPKLIGKTATITEAAQHPSTWYTVRIDDDPSRFIKLQTTAMKILSKYQADTSMPSKPTINTIFSAFTSNITTNKEPPRQLSFAPSAILVPSSPTLGPRARSNSVSNGIAQYTKGTEVRILATENVLQRVPHLVGMVGVVREVPVHPTTWFKIAFPDGSVVTFRPSGFKLADGSEDHEKDGLPPPARKPATRPVKQFAFAAENTTVGGYVTANYEEIKLGAAVRILEGKLSGEIGEVVKLANGRVHVFTVEGEVSKRPHDLALVGRDQLRTGLNGPRQLRASSAAATAKMTSSRKTPSSPRSLAKKNPFASLFPTKSFRSDEDDDSVTSTSLAMPFLYEIERQALDCPFPLVSLAERTAKRAYLKEVIEAESSMITGRPNLSLWLSRIHHVFGVADDEDNRFTSSNMPGAVMLSAPDVVAQREEAIRAACAAEGLDATDDSMTPPIFAPTSPSLGFVASPLPMDSEEDGTLAATFVTSVSVSATSAPTTARVAEDEAGDDEVEDGEDDEDDSTFRPSASVQASSGRAPSSVAAAAFRALHRPLPRDRSDSLADSDETDNEDALSPELTGISEAQLMAPTNASGKEDVRALRDAPSPLALPPVSMPDAAMPFGDVAHFGGQPMMKNARTSLAPASFLPGGSVSGFPSATAAAAAAAIAPLDFSRWSRVIPPIDQGENNPKKRSFSSLVMDNIA